MNYPKLSSDYIEIILCNLTKNGYGTTLVKLMMMAVVWFVGDGGLN